MTVTEADLLRAAQAACHEEQMTVWSGDFAGALSLNGYLRDLSYDEVNELHQTIQIELQRIIASAMQHPEAARVLREAAEGWNFDMDAAPKDGTQIMLLSRAVEKAGDPPQCWIRVGQWVPEFELTSYPDDGPLYRGAWTDFTVASWGYQEFTELTPVAWRPLPLPPSETGK